MAPQGELASAAGAIAFATGPIYSYYEAMPRLWGISVMEDQRIAGVIMWVPGSMMYIVAALIVVGRWLQKEEQKPALPQSSWATDEALAAQDARSKKSKAKKETGVDGEKLYELGGPVYGAGYVGGTLEWLAFFEAEKDCLHLMEQIVNLGFDPYESEFIVWHFPIDKEEKIW